MHDDRLKDSTQGDVLGELRYMLFRQLLSRIARVFFEALVTNLAGIKKGAFHRYIKVFRSPFKVLETRLDMVGSLVRVQSSLPTFSLDDFH